MLSAMMAAPMRINQIAMSSMGVIVPKGHGPGMSDSSYRDISFATEVGNPLLRALFQEQEAVLQQGAMAPGAGIWNRTAPSQAFDGFERSLHVARSDPEASDVAYESIYVDEIAHRTGPGEYERFEGTSRARRRS